MCGSPALKIGKKGPSNKYLEYIVYNVKNGKMDVPASACEAAAGEGGLRPVITGKRGLFSEVYYEKDKRFYAD